MKVNSLKNKGESYSFPPLRTTQIALTPMNSPSDYETEQGALCMAIPIPASCTAPTLSVLCTIQSHCLLLCSRNIWKSDF